MVEYGMTKYLSDFNDYADDLAGLTEKIKLTMTEIEMKSDSSLYNKIFNEDVIGYLEKSKSLLSEYAKNINELNEAFNDIDIKIGNSFRE